MLAPVVKEGVWQCAQPTFMKSVRPFTVEGVPAAGAGGASMRMKSANASMSEMVAVLILGLLVGVAVKLSVSLGEAT